MLGKIKKALGIEGVHVEILLNDDSISNDKIAGDLKFTTKTDSEVRSIKIQLIERYSRGRGKEKLIDEYVLGTDMTENTFSISKSEIIEVPFELPYYKKRSEMDRLQESNFVTAGIVFLAKKIKKVKSEYRLRVDVDVKGTRLDPYDEVVIVF